MPLAVTGADPVGYLLAYAETYLQEEIRAEALTRSIGSFSRFLEVAARQNGQVTNLSAIARDAAVARSTVHNYFEILEDTLVGHWVHAWKLKRATKQVVAHPKFYLFDCGCGPRAVRQIALPASARGGRAAPGDVAVRGDAGLHRLCEAALPRSTTGATTTASRWMSCARRGGDSSRWK